jgi:hypothetical protein
MFIGIMKIQIWSYLNVMKKSVVTRMSLRSDKDVETYLLKSRSDDNEKMTCYRQIVQVQFFFKVRKSSSVALESIRQLISYFFALIIYSINLLKTVRKTFATGNATLPTAISAPTKM